LAQGVNEDFELVEEFLELAPMKGKTGTDNFFSIGKPLKQILDAGTNDIIKENGRVALHAPPTCIGSCY
jgi:hypothetical protein